MAKQRRTLTAEEKGSILRRHLLDGVTVSDLYKEHGLNPELFYRWQKNFFENGTLAFEHRGDARELKLEQKVEVLKDRKCDRYPWRISISNTIRKLYSP